jgi:Rod binding domain-containing protein
MTPDIQTAMSIARAAPVASPHATANAAVAGKAAQDFESVFLSQFLGSMFEGISTDPPFGGGQGEAIFRSLMIDEYAKQMTAQGGIGLADSVTRQLLKSQEVRP